MFCKKCPFRPPHVRQFPPKEIETYLTLSQFSDGHSEGERSHTTVTIH